MPLMTWTEKLSVGVGVLDEDHRKLVQYTKFHFAREEKFFAETGYAAAGPHKQEHDALTRQVMEVQQKYAAGASATLSLDVLQFLKNWLINHIQGSDQKYRPHLNAKGVH